MNHQEKLQDLMREFSHAMLVTQREDGVIAARPMAVAKLETGGQMWFVTSIESDKIDEIRANSQVGVTFQSSNQYVSVSGAASIVDDRAKVDELWSETWRVWFPGGKEDPQLTLLHITPKSAEYWDQSGLKGWKYIIKAGVAYVQGDKVEHNEQTNVEVNL